ncbi:MAG: flagellar M-ring protein FliF [Lachnospiraceae bacterium]|nr:flagellar M-ring protein FliF [Lachnospiraceae bacterium]
MVDRLMAWIRSIPGRIVNWWEKFSRRQKVIIGLLAVLSLAAFIGLIIWITRPEYVKIHTASSAKEAQEVIDLLTGEEIAYKTSEDGLTISINRKDYTAAVLLLGSNSISTDNFSIENVVDGGFFSTEADTQKKYLVYLEQTLEETLQDQDFVRKADVKLSIPEQNGTLIAQNKESYAAVTLELVDKCTTDQAGAMARLVATALGNDTTNNISIVDTSGKLLYAGAAESETSGSSSSFFTLADQLARSTEADVKRALLGLNQFSGIEVAAHISIDMSNYEDVQHDYSNTDTEGDGVLASRDTYQSTNQGTTGGVPGTDANGEDTTGYVYENQSNTSSSVIETSEDFLPDEHIRTQTKQAGDIDRENSSVTVTLLTYKMINEDDVREAGELEGITWEQYKLANDIRTELPVEQSLIMAVSNASGIATGKISILSYEQPFFVDHEGLNIKLNDVLQIILIILILGLLAFVILRSMRQARVEEPEPEISIDDILQSTLADNDLNEIGVEEKSEARRIVEKFVEDNPELAANLLRNWLNEDWS